MTQPTSPTPMGSSQREPGAEEDPSAADDAGDSGRATADTARTGAGSGDGILSELAGAAPATGHSRLREFAKTYLVVRLVPLLTDVFSGSILFTATALANVLGTTKGLRALRSAIE
jgi:hypothetical protein